MPVSALCQALCPWPYTFTTIEQKSDTCHFNPKSVAVDSVGNVYFADARNQVICQMQSSGQISIIAGKLGTSGGSDGMGSQARFNFPRGIAIDAADNVFVADTGNNTIRRITPEGVVTTVAGLAGTVGSTDGAGIYARFNYPASLAVDHLGNIYVADLYNSIIRKVTSHGTVTTIAGQAGIAGSVNGKGGKALFNFPISIAVDGLENIYVADMLNNAIRRVSADGMVTTFAGTLCYNPGNADGAAGSARFCHPCGVCVDKAGNVYVADSGNDTVRQITPEGAVTTLAGLAGQSSFVDGTGSVVRFWHPTALTLDSFGDLYVTDLDNAAIRKGSAAISTNTDTALSRNASHAPKTIFSE
jgi:sugar lactone lactonase YvrE